MMPRWGGRGFRQRSPARQRSGLARLADYALAVAILGLVALIVAHLNRAPPDMRSGVPTVIDGDTIRFGDERIRLVGIDAPEFHQRCFKQGFDAPMDYRCGRLAREALVRFIGGRQVSCTGSERDRYGRLLAVCKAGDIELNRSMVETGWAVSYGGYRDAEAEARYSKVGLWAGDFEQPQEWRREHEIGAQERPNAFQALVDWLKALFRFG